MTLLESLVIVVRVELTWGTNPTIIILPRLADTNRLSYYPRSVHTHFQGLCAVFGLLIYIPSARLTEQCCSHLLWLCESAESDLITSVGWDFRPSLLHLDYTTLLWICQGVFEKFFKNLFEPCKVTSPLLHSASSTLGTVM